MDEKKSMEEAKVHRIRITLTSRSIKDLEKVRADPARVGAPGKYLSTNACLLSAVALRSVLT